MLNKRATALLLLAGSLIASCSDSKTGENWTFVSAGENGTMNFVDLNSVRDADGKRLIAFQNDEPGPNSITNQKLRALGGPAVNFRSYIFAYDCDKRTMAILESKIIFADGSQRQRDPEPYETVLPNSDAEDAMKYACKHSWF